MRREVRYRTEKKIRQKPFWINVTVVPSAFFFFGFEIYCCSSSALSHLHLPCSVFPPSTSFPNPFPPSPSRLEGQIGRPFLRPPLPLVYLPYRPLSHPARLGDQTEPQKGWREITNSSKKWAKVTRTFTAPIRALTLCYPSCLSSPSCSPPRCFQCLAHSQGYMPEQRRYKVLRESSMKMYLSSRRSPGPPAQKSKPRFQEQQ